MDGRPIGVFDSGLGGLTAVRKLMEVLPGEDIIYLGDTGRVPYGTKSHDTIARYAREDIAFLLGFDIKAVLVACGTVSTVALDELAGDFPAPVYGVLHPAVEAAAKSTANRRVGLIGTNATVRSGAFRRVLSATAPDIELFAEACPLLVPLVEAGRTEPEDAVVRQLLEEYLTPVREFGADTLIMGCTHYPLLRRGIARLLPEVTLIDPGAEAAKALAATLARQDKLSGRGEGGVSRYFVTDGTESFERTGSLFLGQSIRGEVTQTALKAREGI